MELEYMDGILLARFKGHLSRKNNFKILNYINPILKKHKIKNLVYNFKNLKSIDESSIDAILKTKITVRNNKGIVYICEVDNNLKNCLKRLHIKFIEEEKTALEMIVGEICGLRKDIKR